MEMARKMQWSCLLLVVSLSSIGATSPTVSPQNVTSTEVPKEGDLDLETQDQVAILKQINRVNEDGSYTFGYEAADGSFKIETRDVNGNVKGMFGFIDEEGELKRVSYSATNGTGFQASGGFDVPPLPGTGLTSEEEAYDRYENVPVNILRQKLLQSSRESSIGIDPSSPPTAGYGDERNTGSIPPPRLPIYIFSTTPRSDAATTTARPVVIQHIPKVRAPSATPVEAERVTGTTAFGNFLPTKTSDTNYVTLKPSNVAGSTAEDEEVTKKPSVIQVIRPRTGPYKKVIVTKRPILETTTPNAVTTTEFYSTEYLRKLKEKAEEESSKEARTQPDKDENGYVTTPENVNLVTSGTEDSPDVYGGSATPRPYTTVAYRTLFTQIPQHQRILQNSYLQNQNRFLAATFPPGLPQPATPRIPVPSQQQDPTRLSPAPPLLPENIGPRPGVFNDRPEIGRGNEPPRPYPVPSQPLNRIFPNPIPLQQAYVNPVQPTGYEREPYNPQLYIPPVLLDSLIRMLLSIQERQLAYQASPTRNLPPELIENRYQQQYLHTPSPYPNYPQAPYPYPLRYVPKTNYDSRPVTYPAPDVYPTAPYYPDPRANNYQLTPVPYRPQLYGPFLGRPPFQPNQDPLLPRMLIDGRAPAPNPVERSVSYERQVPDSTTSSTTVKPRVGSVRNVQILNPDNEENEESHKFQARSTSS